MANKTSFYELMIRPWRAGRNPAGTKELPASDGAGPAYSGRRQDQECDENAKAIAEATVISGIRRMDKNISSAHKNNYDAYASASSLPGIGRHQRQQGGGINYNDDNTDAHAASSSLSFCKARDDAISMVANDSLSISLVMFLKSIVSMGCPTDSELSEVSNKKAQSSRH